MKALQIILFLVLFHVNSIYPTTIVQGNATVGSNTFAQIVGPTVFNPATGTFYIGLAATGGTTYSLSKVIRNNGSQPPKFTDIASSTTTPALNNAAIEFLTLAMSEGDTDPNIAGVILNTGLDQTMVFASNNDGSTATESAVLLDAANGSGVNGNTTAGIVQIAAHENFIFAGVRPNGGTFGTANSGIAVVDINQTDLTLTQAAAVSGDTGIKAKKLDPTVAEVRISADPTLVANQLALHWDDRLERLYMGLQLTTAAGGAKSVVVSRVSDSGVLDFANIGPQSLFTGILKIVGTTSSAVSLSIQHIRTMHCTTGPTYLIINGGNGTAATTGNNIFALPLLDTPTIAATHGALADKDSSLTDGKFTVVPTAASDLPLSTDAPVIVGRNPLPMQASKVVTDIQIVGDTVYVAVNNEDTTADNNNDSGIFYSQAQFDATGKITSWTPWAKRLFPFDAFPTIATPTGRVTNFAIDAVNGKTWSVEGSVRTAVGMTSWATNGPDTTSLTNQLNLKLSAGCFCMLDLPQGTPEFNNPVSVDDSTSRYAVFGGVNKVVFTRISVAKSGATATIKPQTIQLDFSLAENLLETTLPSGSGGIRSLAITGASGSASNVFFLAGTDTGLYIFAQSNGNSFDVNGLGALNTGQISTGVWSKVSEIDGAVIDIVSYNNTSATATDGSIFVLTVKPTSTSPFKSKVYRFSGGNAVANISAFVASRILIGESEVAATGSDLSTTKAFFNMGIFGTDTSTCQLIVATNVGLYRTTKTGGVQNAANQTQAGWTLVDTDNTDMFNYIGTLDNPTATAANPAAKPTTMWPVSVADKDSGNVFNRTNINQLNGTTAATAFVPSSFNTSDGGTTLFEQTQRFWTDGGRRLFIINPKNTSDTTNNLFSLPFDSVETQVSTPQQLNDSSLLKIKRFFWIKQVGVTGMLLAGTDAGVIALQ